MLRCSAWRLGVGTGWLPWLLLMAGIGLPEPAPAQTPASSLPVIQKVEFTGNRHFDDDALRQQMLLQFPRWWQFLRHLGIPGFGELPHYQRNTFPKELRRIEAFYRRQGFGSARATLDSVVALPGRSRRVVLHLGIHEGPRTRLREVRWSPQQVFSLDELRRITPIQAGDPYPFSRAQRGRVTRALRVAFQSRGYLQVAVRDSTLMSPDSTEAVLIFALDPGPQFRVRAVTVSGNAETREELIRRELRFKADDVYSYERVQESEQNLYATGLFRRVFIREENIDLAARTVDLAVYVIERKMAFVEGAIGFGRRDEYEARVIGRWGHRNLLGWGNSLEIQSTLAYNIEKGGDNFFLEERLRYVQPRLFGTRTRWVPQLAYSNDRRIENVELERFQFDSQIFRRLGRYTTLALGVSDAFTTTSLETFTDDQLETRAVNLNLTRNRTDNLFDPRRGDVRSLTVQRAGFGGDNHFTRATSSYARYLSMGRWVLAFGLRGGWVESFGPSRQEQATKVGIDGVPFEFLFQAGGNTTVRGFENNSLGALLTATRLPGIPGTAVVDTFEVQAGTVLLIANVELRMPRPWWVGWTRLSPVLFLDAGNVWSNFEELRTARFGVRYREPYVGVADLRYSWGVGLRYPTPFGPVRFDLGFPLKRAARGRIHLGLGHTF